MWVCGGGVWCLGGVRGGLEWVVGERVEIVWMGDGVVTILAQVTFCVLAWHDR